MACVDLRLTNPKARAAIANRLTEIKNINNRLRDALRTEIRHGFDRGESIDEIATRIQKTFRAERSRALTIARTETGGAASDGLHIQATQNYGDDYETEWISSRDDRVRDSHYAVDGQRRKVGIPFSNGLTRPHMPGAPVGQVVNCFLPGTRVSGRFVAGSKAFYSGPAREIETEGGNRLSVTPNHPVLTDNGFVPANQLRKGDRLLSYRGDVRRSSSVTVNDECSIPLIQDVFHALLARGRHFIVQTVGLDFHGDGNGMDGKVEIVDTARVLMLHGKARRSECSSDFGFIRSDSKHSSVAGFGAGDLYRNGIPLPASQVPHPGTLALNKFAVLLDRRPLQEFCFGPAANWNFILNKDSANHGAGDIISSGHFNFADAGEVFPDNRNLIFNDTLSEAGQLHGVRSFSNYLVLEKKLSDSGVGDSGFCGDVHHRYSGLIQTDAIIGIRDFQYSGHVYDLQTDVGYILAQNILCSNCRCTTLIHPHPRKTNYIPAVERTEPQMELRVWEETENEIRFRIREPEKFEKDSFRRITIKQHSPRIFAIIGRLKGEQKTSIQSLRFPKDDGWTMGTAKEWVKGHPDVTKDISPWRLREMEPLQVLAPVALRDPVDDKATLMSPETQQGPIATQEPASPMVIPAVDPQERGPINIHIDMGSLKLPDVNVHVEQPKAPEIIVNPSPIVVNVPEQKSEITVNVPEQKPPEVKVFNPPPMVIQAPSRKTIKNVERGEHGEITRIVEEEE